MATIALVCKIDKNSNAKPCKSLRSRWRQTHAMGKNYGIGGKIVFVLLYMRFACSFEFDTLMLCFEIRNEATAGSGHHIAGDGLPLDGPGAPHDANVVHFRTPQRRQPLGDRVVWTPGAG